MEISSVFNQAVWQINPLKAKNAAMYILNSIIVDIDTLAMA